MRALGFSVQDSHINASLSVKISGSDTSDLKVTISRDNGNSIEIPYSDWVINEKMNGFYGPRFESSYGTFNLYTSTINGNVISSPETALLSFIGSLDTLTTNGTISPIGALFSKESVPNGTTVDTTLPPHSSTSTITEIGANRTPNQVFIQSGCDTMDGIILEIDKMSTRSLGINDLNVSTLKGADKVIAIMDSALEKLSMNRSKIGAQQNRLEHTIANEDNTIENTTASESRIRDTDMAEEMVNYSMNNILSQAGQAMIAQANQSTQGILSLLQ
ncbi:MAG: hypothetical protein IJO60_11820 [Agathobacter sp.]|nr:hypothetical protein [Agathobacter sp.]